MAEQEASARKTFQRQPARSILLEFQCPMNSETCLNIQQALSETLTFLNHLSGPCRLPYLSLFILGNYPEVNTGNVATISCGYIMGKCIFPLQPIKGNFPRVHAAMNELKSLAGSFNMRQSSNSSRGCVLEGFQEALSQFQRFSQNFRQGPNIPALPSQIELTLITARSSTTVRSLIEQITNHLDLRHLRKIGALCVSDPTSLLLQSGGPADDGGGGQIEMSQQFGCGSPSELSLSILDLHNIENDVLSLCSHFRGWFHDSGTDSEHLHLVLPSPSDCMAMEGEAGECEAAEANDRMVLKCDMQERILDPALFGAPLTQQMGLHVALPPGHTPSNRGRGGSVAMATSTSSTLPLYTLKAVATLPAEGVCESILFGVPLIVRPTACWKLEWEELEINQQHFTALCTTLKERDLVLLVRSEHTSPYHAHFLLIPSSTPLTLLIRSIAVCEQLLPLELSTGCSEEDLQPSKSSLNAVGMSLDQLEHHQSYNPLQVHSGLNKAVLSLSLPRSKGNLSRTSASSHSTSSGRGRRNYQPPVQRDFCDNVGTGSTSRGRGSRAGRGGASRNLGTTRRSVNKQGLGFEGQ